MIYYTIAYNNTHTDIYSIYKLVVYAYLSLDLPQPHITINRMVIVRCMYTTYKSVYTISVLLSVGLAEEEQ